MMFGGATATFSLFAIEDAVVATGFELLIFFMIFIRFCWERWLGVLDPELVPAPPS
jgi:hypothetical protein